MDERSEGADVLSVLSFWIASIVISMASPAPLAKNGRPGDYTFIFFHLSMGGMAAAIACLARARIQASEPINFHGAGKTEHGGQRTETENRGRRSRSMAAPRRMPIDTPATSVSFPYRSHFARKPNLSDSLLGAASYRRKPVSAIPGVDWIPLAPE